ncbi:heavy metal-binding domain-containing protein [Psychrobacter sanguinis]|uniref:YbjQ family protein n=1 Tax=Psychrobacter sanguinis TaxID=861445 RepID=UPI002A766792|nr:heavy metal-binding domain-containing protein [Psychrobacter sanguinis]MDY3306056.1 heavy metal-binding domain-containing protein [Psychrobacter sanguinis]
MDTVSDFIINNIVFIGLFFLGWVFGRLNEGDHLKRLDVAEKELGHIIVSSERFYQPKISDGTQGILVMGSVVIAQDYFKMIIARILSLFGKNLTTYETLLDRARREAVLRMKLEAQFLGYNQVYGLRLEVTSINLTGSMVEAIAYGTAVYNVDNPRIPPPLPM